MAELNRGITELIVQGPAGQILRQRLVEGQVVRLGRAPASGWAVEWDRLISRARRSVLAGRTTLSHLFADRREPNQVARGASTRSLGGWFRSF